MKLPLDGTVFLSVRDADKQNLVGMARRLIAMGFAITATARHGQARIGEAGLTVKLVNKVLEGRPHCVDAIRSGDIQLVINTAGGAQSLADSFRHPPLRPDPGHPALHDDRRRQSRGARHSSPESGNA